MKYIGFCGPRVSKPTEWGDGDRIGTLLAEFPDGWRRVGGHYSSSEAFSRQDIGAAYQDRPNPSDADTYEWLGEQAIAAVADLYPPAVEVAP